jgi:hypothetical protein
MGFLKKIFKPISKVLDKIIPNEIKPALPYLAAFAPVFGPTAGMFGSTMGKRMLLSGGANILGQLSQEGSEGDINLLSAGLGALTGAMTTPGAAETFKGMKTFDGRTITDIGEGTIAGKATGLERLKNIGLEGLSKGSNILRPEGGIPDLFSKAGAKAATLPASTATGDVMQASARQLEKQAAIDDALAQAELLEDSGARAAAIRNAMNAYGFFTDEEIDDTIFSAGYADGGRVGLMEGGLGALGGAMKKEPETFSLDESDIQIVIPDNNPKIVGEGTQGGEKMLLIEVNGNTMMISEDEFYNKFGESKAKGGRVGLRFGGIGDAVENIEDAEMKESVKFAMQDMDIPIMDLVEEFEIQFKRKPNSMEELKQFYKDRYEYKGPGDVKMKEEIKEKVVMEAKDGGRIGFKDGSDGSSTGNFGADRYASELIEAYGSMLNKGDMFLTDVEKELIERGEYPSPDKMKDFQTRYENLEKEYEKEENKFDNTDIQDSLFDEDAIKYYNKKIKDLEDREERLMDKEEEINEVMYTDLDVSGILKTPEFQEWYKLWKAKDPKADDLPNAEYFENMMFDTKRLRPDVMKTKYDFEMKDGGLMNLGGKEMDLRGGGFVPIGKKERADDVPARLSKNEFVMTADAVRAAGGGSVNEGAKRMYETMNKLEAKA